MRIADFRGYFRLMGPAKLAELLLFGLFILVFFGPLANLAMLAFSDTYFYPAFMPPKLSLKWWGFVLSQNNLADSMLLSFAVAIGTTLIAVAICVPAAYAFARIKFPGRQFFFFSFLLSNAFPKIGLYVSIGVVFYKLNLMGTLPGVFLIHIVNTMMYMTWIPAGAFRTVHKEQEEAARDAGANAFQTFLRINLPIAMPGIMVAAVFTFLSSLQEAQGTLLVGVPNYKTIPVVMYSVIFDYPSTAGAAFSLILLVPTIAILLAARHSAGSKALAEGFKL
jgi:putative spermidine/putrescine transport system permease protein